MKFPLVSDIASRDVVSIDIDSSISDAIEHMIAHEHRNVLVRDGSKYYIFTVLDVLNIQSEKISLEIKLKDINLSEISTINRDQNVLDTLEYLNDALEYICVINRDKSLYGLLTHTDIISNIDPDTLMDNFRLDDFLKLGRRVKWVHKDDQTLELLDSIVSGSFDNVIIVEKKKPIGILTTKDIMELIKNRSDLSLSVSHYMSSPVDSIEKTATIKEALNFVKSKNYKRVVVVNSDGELAGIVAQKELISLTYSRWAVLMKEYQSELSEINHMLENKNREYEVMASTDSLTGLYNRHKFSELYISSYTSMIQRDAKMSLIMVDIDFFKKVNDTYGHNIGDKVLIQVAHSLIRTLRHIDIVCRWGGEEFVILLPTATLENAEFLANKLKDNMHHLDIDKLDAISASFGVAEVREGDEMQDVIGRADKALYLAKEFGRDCVKTELDS
jgi:diguanylate cyclase (GGDEF)-like protein